MRLLKPAVLLLCASALVFAVWQWIGLRRSEMAFDAARNARERLDAAIHVRETDIARRAALKSAENDRMRSVAISRAHGGSAPEAGAAGSSAAASKNALKRAELRQRYLGAYRASLESAFALLFQRLHLTPAEQSALLDLLQQREANNLTVEEAARGNGVDESDPEIEALDESLSDANKAAMVDLLGKPGERAVHAFLQEQSVLPQVNELVAATADAGVPMTPDQSAALLQALANASARKPSGQVIEGIVDWTQAEAKTAPLFSPDQLSILQIVGQEQANSQKMNQMVAAMNAH